MFAAPITEDDALDPGLRAAFGRAERDSGAVADVLRSDYGIDRGVLLRDDPAEDADILKPSSAAVEIPARYRVAGELARGGIGVVLKGQDVDLGRDVALKILRPEHARNPTLARRLVDEAQIGGQLQHPGILPVYELGLDAARRPFFAMKLVRGETLASLLDRRKSPDEDHARFLGIFEAVGHALAYAHARGVIHRDLKPSNVMVGRFGEVQVVDWGLAKVLKCGESVETRDANASDASGAVDLSEDGSVLGTPAYMPPEQALGQIERLDERSDVFGLGAILCEVLTGRPPYVGARHEILDQARAARLGPASDRLARCGASDELIDLARRCLHPDRDGRPRDAGEVVRAVQAHREAMEARARLAELEAERAKVRLAAERLARHLTVALAAVLVIASGAVGWFAYRTESERYRAAEAEIIAQRAEVAREREHAARLRAALDLDRERQARLEAALGLMMPLEAKSQYVLRQATEAEDRDLDRWIEVLALLRQIAERNVASAPNDTARRGGRNLVDELRRREDELRARLAKAREKSPRPTGPKP